LKYLACQHHLVMVEELRQNIDCQNPGLKSILVLGLGGGALCTYLHQTYPQFKVDGVEIDSTMLDLARKYFGFKPSENLRPHIADGLSFVRDLAASGNEIYAILPYFIIKICNSKQNQVNAMIALCSMSIVKTAV